MRFIQIIFFYQHYMLFSGTTHAECNPELPVPSRYASIGTDDNDDVMIRSERAVNSDSSA